MKTTGAGLIREAIGKAPWRYHKRRLPVPYDDVLSRAVRMLRDLPERERADLRESLTDSERNTLGTFSFRMAELAVINRDPKCIAGGLLALVISDFRPEYQYGLMTLSLHYHSANLIGVAPAGLIEDAAQYASPTAAVRYLQGFIVHPRTIGQMGLRETGSGADFRYEMDPRFG